MSRGIFGVVLLLLAAAPLRAAAGTHIHLAARDVEGQPLSGICFTDGVFLSKPTIATGTTELDLPSGHLVELVCVHSQAPNPPSSRPNLARWREEVRDGSSTYFAYLPVSCGVMSG